MSAAGAGPVLAPAITPIAGVRSLALAANASADVPVLPPGFPAQLTGPMTWTGSDLVTTSDYILVLNDTWHAEIKAAVEHYKCKCSSSSCRLAGA
jgi:hypothetical protein